MANKRNSMGFNFEFKSKNKKSDEIWNDGGCVWDEFSDVMSVPMVGDIINFWYILVEMGHNRESFKILLDCYNTAMFRVVERVYCPFNTKDKDYENEGVFCQYYLIVEPVKDQNLEFHLSQTVEPKR